MRYAEALAWLYGLESRGIRLGLGRMRGAVTARGNPQQGLPVVHVAGTNGKGSTCAMIERGLRAAGYRTGWFSSPHLHRYVERVRIAGRPISEAEAAKRLTELRAATGLPRLTFFEYTTLLAFEAFRDHGCDAVVLEVGLGGRLDSTNVVTPRVSVITHIALEHTQILGSTTRAIAREKAGIIKPGVPVVCSVRDRDAWNVIRDRARRLGAPVARLGRDFGVDVDEEGQGPRVCVWDGPDRSCAIKLALRGPYQRDNAASAAAALRRFDADTAEVSIPAALSKTKWPGRMERFRAEGTAFLLDGAHNPSGCAALAEEVRTRPPKGKVVLLFGAMADKDHEAMLAPLDDVVARRVYAIPKMRRAPEASVFADVRPGSVARSVREGVMRARRAAGADGLVVVAGSLFLVAEVRALVLRKRSDPPIAM